ncbi:Glycosyltransferase family 1 protein [Mycena kentingensis (nom. inval.)]|nr:Glycosyltransferase family 1 protein [Mycena kentingensis (nom. inval.)]
MLPPMAEEFHMSLSTTSTRRADTTSTSDEESLHASEPVVSSDHFFSEAVQFKQILTDNGLIEESKQENGFDALVGKDLSAAEIAIVSRATKLAATGDRPSWTPSPQSSVFALVEESASYVDETDAVTDAETDSTAPSEEHPGSAADSESWKLDSSQIISLLVDEFGALAPQGEEEKLVLEADGGLVKDVSILGVIHLTTHRLAFHASLLAASPTPQTSIIRAGPVVIHRKGWRFKRRLWLELSHDMLCTYVSSKAPDRLKPVRTILLSAIRDIGHVDAKRPRCVKLHFDPQFLKDQKMTGGHAEFDTEESAQEWRRELAGALFLYRHRRREAIDGSENGVRWSCPLSHIISVEFLDPNLPSVATLAVDVGSPAGPRHIRIGTIYDTPEFKKLPKLLADYRELRKTHPSELDDTPIFVDLGPIDFGPPMPTVPVTDLKESVVRNVLGLSAEHSFWMCKGRLYRTLASGGVFIVTDHYICFWSRFITQEDLRYRLHISLIREAKPFRLLRNCSFGMAIELEGHPDIRFQFRANETRDEAIQRVNAAVTLAKEALPPPPPTPSSTAGSGKSTPSLVSASTSASGITPSTSTPTRSMTAVFSPLERTVAAVQESGTPRRMQSLMPKAINLPSQILVRGKSMHFVCLTIGSRGDVQPYIALGLGLMKEGHTVTIVTHEEYKPWVESFGIEHKHAGGDPGALMKLSVENKMFSPEFFKESLQNFRPWLDQLLIDAWESCQGADVLLESPSAMAGIHIAEALNIPYFRTFTMPWTKTTDFPHAFLSPPVEAPTFNSASYVLFANVMWAATSGQINRWRRNTLHIGNTDMTHLEQSKVPFVYNFSQAVVPKPLDWNDSITVSGYWFLDNPEGANWTPPQDLVDWMAKARADEKPIVYIGFGSITVPHPNRVTARIVKAVLKSGVRAIISKGWSARMSKGNEKDPEVEIPPECFVVNSIPHDWLFPRIDAAMHHGGAGTTGGVIEGGDSDVDQAVVWGPILLGESGAEAWGVFFAGLRVNSLHSNDLAEALTTATTSRVMKEKAAAAGEKIRAEDGVHTAIHTIYTYLEHAAAYIEKIRDHSH